MIVKWVIITAFNFHILQIVLHPALFVYDVWLIGTHVVKNVISRYNFIFAVVLGVVNIVHVNPMLYFPITL